MTKRAQDKAGAGRLVPTGTVFPFAGSVAPDGWVLCYGQPVSRTVYEQLFAVIGTAYGAGDGSTTFNLPDLRGRAVAGKDDMGGSAATRLTSVGSGINGTILGASGGAQNHTLSASESGTAVHNHGTTTGGTSHSHGNGGYTTSLGISEGSYALSGTTSFASITHHHSAGPNMIAAFTMGRTAAALYMNYVAGAPTPGWTSNYTAQAGGTGAPANITVNEGPRVLGTTDGPASGGTATVSLIGSAPSLTGSNAVTGVSGAEAAHTHNTNDHGGSAASNAHQNVQPSIVLNYIIKY